MPDSLVDWVLILALSIHCNFKNKVMSFSFSIVHTSAHSLHPSQILSFNLRPPFHVHVFFLSSPTRRASTAATHNENLPSTLFLHQYNHNGQHSSQNHADFNIFIPAAAIVHDTDDVTVSSPTVLSPVSIPSLSVVYGVHRLILERNSIALLCSSTSCEAEGDAWRLKKSRNITVLSLLVHS